MDSGLRLEPREWKEAGRLLMLHTTLMLVVPVGAERSMDVLSVSILKAERVYRFAEGMDVGWEAREESRTSQDFPAGGSGRW